MITGFSLTKWIKTFLPRKEERISLSDFEKSHVALDFRMAVLNLKVASVKLEKAGGSCVLTYKEKDGVPLVTARDFQYIYIPNTIKFQDPPEYF